jgi:uncharacterized protein YcgI (DUF1989 family)/serine/threonine protein kinase
VAVSETIIGGLFSLFARYTLRFFFQGTDVEFLGAGAIELGKNVTLDYLQQRQATGAADDIAGRVVELLRKEFEAEGQAGPIDVNAVAAELNLTLEHAIGAEDAVSPQDLIDHDFNAEWLVEELRSRRQPENRVLSQSGREFYEKALGRTARFLVEIATLLPTFQAKATSESLTRLRRAVDGIEKAVSSLTSVEKVVALLNPEDKARQYETNYRQAVCKNLDGIELFGVDVPGAIRKVPLTKTFVSLSVSTGIRDIETIPSDLVLERMGHGSNRLLIRGAAGSGKTTLMRWAAIQAAQFADFGSGVGAIVSAMIDNAAKVVHRDLRPQNILLSGVGRSMRGSLVDLGLVEGLPRLSDPDFGSADAAHDQIMQLQEGQFRPAARSVPRDLLSNWYTRIPFYIALRDCQDGRLPSPDDMPAMIGKGICKPPEAWVDQVLRSGKAMVLIDGADEVPPKRRHAIKTEISQIVKNYHKDNLYIVTTRPAAVESDWLKDLGFAEAEVAEMPDADIRQLVEAWYAAVEEKLTHAGDDVGDLSQRAMTLFSELQANPRVMQLARNPLMCSVICALNQSREQKLPGDQRELCEALCNMMLYRREDEQSDLQFDKFPEAYRDLSYAHRRDLLQELAQEMCLRGSSALDRSVAEGLIRKPLAAIEGRTADDAKAVLQALIERSGMLRARTEESVDFLHNTFKEFLAGEYFAELRDVTTLAEHAVTEQDDGNETTSTWTNVVLFAVATSGPASRDFPGKLIEAILPDAEFDGAKRPARQRKTDPIRQRHLLALQCAAYASYIDSESLRDRLKVVRRNVLPPKSFSEAMSVARLGNSVVAELKPRSKMAARTAAACIRALRTIGTVAAMEVLEQYVERSEKRVTVLSELACGVNPLRIPWVLERIQDMDQPLPDWAAAQITDLNALSGLTSLRVLNLSGAQVADLSALSGLTSLKRLYLNGTQVTDLSALSGLTSLQVLDLDGTQVTDLSALSGLTSLERLYLNGTQVTDLSALSGLTSLQVLDLDGTQVTDLSALSSLTLLQGLYLSGTQVTDLSALSSLTLLRGLILNVTQVTDLSALSSLTSLQVLFLNGTQVTDLSALSGLTSLERLYLNGTQVTDVSALSSLTSLQWVGLKGTQVTDLSALSGLTKLQVIR